MFARFRPLAACPILATSRLTAVLLALTLSLGCGSDGDSGLGPGAGGGGGGNGGGGGGGSDATFSVTVTGAETFVATGTIAWSGGTAAENGWEVRLESTDPASPLQSLAIYGDGDRPAPGAYAIVSVAGSAGPNEFYGRCTPASGAAYYATGGTLTISSSSDAVVEGAFGFAGEASGGALVTVAGTFRADDLLDE